MLVLFRFKNYGPFKEEVVFDMRAIRAYKEHSYNLINEENREPLLKVVSIYGANASGKTHFVNAYSSFLDIVLNSFKKNNKDESSGSILQMNHTPFCFDESKDNSTEFEAVYRKGDSEYKYGFIYDDCRIKYEWLYKRSLNTNRQSRIFERTAKTIELGSSVKNSCEKYLEDIDLDVLALSFFSSLKLKTNVFSDVVYCISDLLPISLSCKGEGDYLLRTYFEKSFNKVEKQRLLKFLHAIDVGIKDIDVEKNDNKVAVYTWHIGKNGKKYKISFDLESDGTKRAIAVYSIARIAVLYERGLIVDEFNSQLHPLLQKYIIDLFYDEKAKGQLIYTTHDTFLLDKQYMRRDQIWFVNKDNFGEASLYSLAEYKIRNDKSFGKDYLGGIYGGIPILKKFSFEEE